MTQLEKPVPATCKCGHRGRSKQPDYYQCGYCYYTAMAKGNEDKILKIADRIVKCEEAKRFKKRAAEFRKRHPRLK